MKNVKTVEEAAAYLNQMTPEELLEILTYMDSTLPEAPASVNFRITVGGIEKQFTLRDFSEMKLWERVQNFEAILLADGALAAKSTQSTSTASEMYKDDQGNEWFTGSVDCVGVIVQKGAQRWAEIAPVPGTKFPLRAWDEVLKTVEHLIVDGQMNLAGCRMMFTRNEKGYPSKIVKIEE